MRSEYWDHQDPVHAPAHMQGIDGFWLVLVGRARAVDAAGLCLENTDTRLCGMLRVCMLALCLAQVLHAQSSCTGVPQR